MSDLQQKTISQTLGERLGGTWEYEPGKSRWFCDDKKRHVTDFSDGMTSPPCFMLFEDGKIPSEIKLF